MKIIQDIKCKFNNHDWNTLGYIEVELNCYKLLVMHLHCKNCGEQWFDTEPINDQ